MLKQRVITAVILALIVAVCLLQQDPLWMRLLFTVMLCAATYELILLTLRTTRPLAITGALPFIALFWWSGDYVNALLIFWQSLTGAVLWVLISIGLCFYRHSGNWPLLARVLLLGLGLDLLWICGHGLVFLHLHYGAAVLFYLLSLVWVADIGAYFIGKRFGRHKLAPSISPGKTREGLLGGLASSLLWMIVVYQASAGWGLALLPFLLIGVITSLSSVFGDLFESVLKREAGVKDSSRLLPGHGGVLDRIDGLLAATPVFLSGILFAGQM
jgi:phosphatidate cytidylyltransferase